MWCKICLSTTVNVTPDRHRQRGDPQAEREGADDDQVLQSGVNLTSHSFFRNRLFKRYLRWSFSKPNSLLQKNLCEVRLVAKCST